MWQQLRSKIQRRLRKGYRALQVSDEDIASFQDKYSFKLPRSFIAYLQEVGPGCVNRFFCIDGPFSEVRDGQMFTEVAEIRASELLAKIYGDEKLIQRCVAFGDSIAGDIFIWDPLRLTDKRNQEYQILVLPRFGKKALPIAKSFKEFVAKVIFGHAFEDTVCGERDPDWEIHYELEPVSKRITKSRRK